MEAKSKKMLSKEKYMESLNLVFEGNGSDLMDK